MASNYQIALLQKPSDSGLTKEDIFFLLDILETRSDDSHRRCYYEVIPVEFKAENHECSAMGFMFVETAEELDFDYESSGLHKYIASILDDTEKEIASGHYEFNGISIYMEPTT